jgi:hypothetical protein
MDKILNARSKISSSSPNILDESYFFRIDFELLSQPFVIELNAFIFKEYVFVRLVKNLDAYHDKS